MDFIIALGIIALNVQLYKLSKLLLVIDEQTKDAKDFNHGKL